MSKEKEFAIFIERWSRKLSEKRYVCDSLKTMLREYDRLKERENKEENNE